MPCAKSNRLLGFAALALFSALFAFGGVSAARAQEPPTSIPPGGPLPFDPNAIPFNSWLLYPSVNFLAENSNNYFITPQSKLSGWAFGVDPSMTAEWSNGIHTTTLYGNFQQLQYPPDGQVPQESKITSPSGEATWTQQYAPLRDLNFTFAGDYVHQTLSPALTSSIPTPTAFTGTTILSNGDIVLPNGTIVSPTGQILGQVGPTASVGPTAFVNPYDQYTASAKVQKIFNGGIVTLGTSVQQVDYEHAGTTNFNNKYFSEDASFWLGPVFYAYTDGSFNIRTTDPNGDSTAYRITGGIGTRQFGLFRTSAYFGYQGSGGATPDLDGGDVYGAAFSYYPTAVWTISANIDETINHAPANAPPSTQALAIPGITPLQIPITGATKVTSTSLHSSYVISPQWTVNGLFAYVHIDNIGSPIWDDSWVGDASVSYNIWRDLTLALEYQYSSIVSNQPQTNANRNLITMSATYKF
jgi:hypothetical protein